MGTTTHPLSFTPLKFGTYTVKVSTAEGTQSTGSTTLNFNVNGATQLAPAAGVNGPDLNPTFVWQGTPGELFAVDLESVTSNESEGYELQANGYQASPLTGAD